MTGRPTGLVPDHATLSLSLVSHTNLGKTTLARTLLRREVGDVFDKAHVTDTSEPYVLVETHAGAKLVLWDTPGFGDSARLLRRLRSEGTPLSWLLAQVWDRFMDRPVWCSQQAVRNVRDQADVVLYLVNAAESAEMAGYLDMELEILEWIDRPVLLLLNQTGPSRGAEAERAEVERWRQWAARFRIVRDVVSLDAFTRCWVQEGILLEHIGRVLPEPRRDLLRSLLATWQERNRAVFASGVGAIAASLAATAADREPVAPNNKSGRTRAAEALKERVRKTTRELAETLIGLHELEGSSRALVQADAQDQSVTGAVLDERRLAVMGGVVGGLLGGLTADLLSGGLTFGGGTVAGAITGALGSAGLARFQRLLKHGGQPAVAWAPPFLDRLAEEYAVRYLAVAHFGRGRGGFRDLDEPAHWRELVRQALAGRKDALRRTWNELAGAPPPARREELARSLRELVAGALETVLVRLYPESAHLLS